jgi:ABC-type sugar transport system permease subunit
MLKAPGLFRILFFLPYVVPFVAGVLIWQLDAQPGQRLAQRVPALASASPDPPNWLQDPAWVYPGLVIIGIWGIGGGIIVYLAGLPGIPTELYDAAKIDGAGWWAASAT